MITAQDIREKSFEKAVFGGYDMAMVDEFMEEIANDLTLLQKENTVLKGKMKVLVDKVDEYRGNEEALRNAVFSAQKLGTSIEQDAKERANAILDDARSKAETILSDARAEAKSITEGAGAELKAEEARLQETKKVSAEFIDRMDQLCRRQLEFLDRVGDMDFMREYHASRQSVAAAVNAPPIQAQVQAQVQRPAARPAGAAPVSAPVSAPAPSPAPVAAAPVQAAPVQAAQRQGDGSEIHETVKSIEETVARVMDEPVINVRPGISPTLVEDERPTRSFNIVTDPEDDVDRSTQFSLDDYRK